MNVAQELYVQGIQWLEVADRLYGLGDASDSDLWDIIWIADHFSNKFMSSTICISFTGIFIWTFRVNLRVGCPSSVAVYWNIVFYLLTVPIHHVPHTLMYRYIHQGNCRSHQVTWEFSNRPKGDTYHRVRWSSTLVNSFHELMKEKALIEVSMLFAGIIIRTNELKIRQQRIPNTDSN